MTQNLIDKACVLIRKEIGKANSFVDANAIAAVIHDLYPTVDFQSLVSAVVEETIATRGTVAWGKGDKRSRLRTEWSPITD